MDPYIIPAMLILFFAAAVQGITGFGRALIAAPLIALFMPADETVVYMILMGFISAVAMVWKTHENADIKRVVPLMITGILGSIAGVQVLRNIPVKELRIAMGVFVILSALVLATGLRVKFKKEVPAYAVAGFLSGFFNGAISFGGPPIVLFLQNQNETKNSFRANLSVFFLIIGLTGSINLAAGGLISGHMVINALFLAPATVGGTIFGNLLSNKFNEELFRKMVLGILFVSGALAVVMTLM